MDWRQLVEINVSPGLPVQVNKQDACIPCVQLMEDAQAKLWTHLCSFWVVQETGETGVASD